MPASHARGLNPARSGMRIDLKGLHWCHDPNGSEVGCIEDCTLRRKGSI